MCVLRNHLLNSRWGIPFLIQKSLIEMFCGSYSVLYRNQAFSKSLLLIIPFYCLLNLTAQRYKLFHGLPKTTFGRLHADCWLLITDKRSYKRWGDDGRTLFLNPSVKIALTNQILCPIALDIFMIHKKCRKHQIPMVSIQFRAHVWFKVPVFDDWLLIIDYWLFADLASCSGDDGI